MLKQNENDQQAPAQGKNYSFQTSADVPWPDEAKTGKTAAPVTPKPAPKAPATPPPAGKVPSIEDAVKKAFAAYEGQA